MPAIKLARSIGFCSGVQRAITIAQRVLSSSKGRVYSLGPIIHNREVIESLQARGLIPVRALHSVPVGSCVILPSHGSARSILDAARKKRLRLVDVTCPHVSAVQKTCASLAQDKLEVVIIGDKDHPEVRALRDLACKATVVTRPSDLRVNQFSSKRIGIISQTTQSKEAFWALVATLINKNHDIRELHIYNTICRDTAQRQEEVKRLAGAVDTLLVIGSATSANTKRLLHRARKVNQRSFLVENERSALRAKVKDARVVGVISGASAPLWLVDRIVGKVKQYT